MTRLRCAPRIVLRSLGLLAFASALMTGAADAQAQSGAVYRCAPNDFTNTLTEGEATSRHCAKIGNAEWVFSGSDSAGRQYTYNDRRTVFREDGTVETWLQVMEPQPIAAASSDSQALLHVRTVSPQVVHCRERTIASGATYFLDLRDNSVTKDSSMRTALFPPPEGVAAALIRRLCADRQPAERSLASR